MVFRQIASAKNHRERYRNRHADKPFKVKTVGWSDENIYVQSVKLNGRAYNKLFITHADIVNGGTLEFTMSSVPGNFKHAILPPSMSETLNE